jgi:hypothetical protein
MADTDDIAFVADLLDRYAAAHPFMVHPACEDPADWGVPPDMVAGPVDAEGWVPWKLLPSTVTGADVAALEREFGVTFPPLFRAYLMARFHLFDQVGSRRHGRSASLPTTRSHDPFRTIRNLLTGCRELIPAGYIPFGQWGDGWGPLCFDAARRAADGDCPVVWMEHEELVPLAPEEVGRREVVEPLAEPLYDSCRDLLLDVFAPRAV